METKLGHAKSFKDLEVYKQSRELAKKIFELSINFPKEERYSLTDQIRRSSRSIGAQIAESWGKRRYENHFILKLTDSDSEQYETRHWLEISLEIDILMRILKTILLVNVKQLGKCLIR